MKASAMKTNQAVCLLALFLMGDSMVFGMDGGTGRDAPFALLLAAALALPVLLLYARTLSLFPDMDFYDILRHVFGKWAGSALILLWAAYAVYKGALLLRGVSDFFIITTLPAPPWFLFPLVFTGAALYLMARGAETPGKWAVVTASVVGTVFILLWFASFKDMDWDHILPVLRREPAAIARGSFSIASDLFLDCVLFLPLLSPKSCEAGPYKVLLRGTAAAFVFGLLILLQNLLLLGEPLLDRSYFPLYSASRIISVGQFLTRLETVIFLYIILTGLTRFAVLLSAARDGITRAVKIKKPLWAAVPLSLLCFILSYWLGGNISDVFYLKKTEPYYSAPFFHILLPVLLWLVSERKARNGAKKRKT